MPLLVTFKSRPVKRHRRVDGGLLLTFYAAQPGLRGARLFVSDDAWRRFSRTTFFPPGALPNVRELAAAQPPSS